MCVVCPVCGVCGACDVRDVELSATVGHCPSLSREVPHVSSRPRIFTCASCVHCASAACHSPPSKCVCRACATVCVFCLTRQVLPKASCLQKWQRVASLPQPL